MKIACLIPVLFLTALAGCMRDSVPVTHISGSLGGKPFDLSAPKDVNLIGLALNTDTNGTVSLSISNLSARMNPDVITTTGAAQVQMINAVGEQVIKGLGAAKP